MSQTSSSFPSRNQFLQLDLWWVNQNSDFLASGGLEKGLLHAITFSHLFNLEKLCLEFPIFYLYLLRVLQTSLKTEKQTKHPSVGTWQGEVVVMKRRKWMNCRKEKIQDKQHTKLPGSEVYQLWSWKMLQVLSLKVVAEVQGWKTRCKQYSKQTLLDSH